MREVKRLGVGLVIVKVIEKALVMVMIVVMIVAMAMIAIMITIMAWVAFYVVKVIAIFGDNGRRKLLRRHYCTSKWAPKSTWINYVGARHA